MGKVKLGTESQVRPLKQKDLGKASHDLGGIKERWLFTLRSITIFFNDMHYF